MNYFTQSVKMKGAVSALFLFMFCFLGSGELNAQVFGELVPEGQASVLIADLLPGLTAAVDQAQPGSAEYVAAVKKFNMYNHTWEHVSNGKALEGALQDTHMEFAVDAAGNPLGLDEFSGISKNPTNFGDTAFNSLVALVQL